jgi:predicted 2-oxoglutarate/Fe(II)-dependent dioxygenase YbiX/peroxiredoxin
VPAANDIVPLNAPPAPAPPLYPGDPAPWFRLPSDTNERFPLPVLGGRTILLTFLNSFSRPEDACVRDGLLACASRLQPYKTALLIVSADPADRGARVAEGVGGVRYLFDGARAAAGLFGVASDDGVRATSFVIDARLRINAVLPVRDAPSHGKAVFEVFERLHAPGKPFRGAAQAPVLSVPAVFEAGLCADLVARHRASGGFESGFMVERDGMTVQRHDPEHKRRRDWLIEDRILIEACRERVRRRIVPEILRAFQFEVTRIERYVVACYRGEDKGHFAAHRDNTTKGTQHRRFAVSINLNADYEGGELVFPEFGEARFRPPEGGACVFSCSLMHRATPVTSGERYVFVPFLYDNNAAAIREANVGFLAPDA